MISVKRCWAIFLRYFFITTKLDQMADLFYWPAIDIFVWGVTTTWIQGEGTSVPGISLMILTALIFWHILWRGNYEVSVNLLQEFWNRNLVNLFSTPLKLLEWVGGILLICLFKIGVSLIFGSLFVLLLYEMNVFSLGWAFLPFVALLLLSGWLIGFLAASIIIYWGQRFQMLAWMLAWVFAPLSAIYYPVSALPMWAQKVAWCLPMTYIFEGMRIILINKVFPLRYFLISLGWHLLYFSLAIFLFRYMFEKSRAKGLARLE